MLSPNVCPETLDSKTSAERTQAARPHQSCPSGPAGGTQSRPGGEQVHPPPWRPSPGVLRIQLSWTVGTPPHSSSLSSAASSPTPSLNPGLCRRALRFSFQGLTLLHDDTWADMVICLSPPTDGSSQACGRTGPGRNMSHAQQPSCLGFHSALRARGSADNGFSLLVAFKPPNYLQENPLTPPSA